MQQSKFYAPLGRFPARWRHRQRLPIHQQICRRERLGGDDGDGGLRIHEPFDRSISVGHGARSAPSVERIIVLDAELCGGRNALDPDLILVRPRITRANEVMQIAINGGNLEFKSTWLLRLGRRVHLRVRPVAAIVAQIKLDGINSAMHLGADCHRAALKHFRATRVDLQPRECNRLDAAARINKARNETRHVKGWNLPEDHKEQRERGDRNPRGDGKAPGDECSAVGSGGDRFGFTQHIAQHLVGATLRVRQQELRCDGLQALAEQARVAFNSSGDVEYRAKESL